MPDGSTLVVHPAIGNEVEKSVTNFEEFIYEFDNFPWKEPRVSENAHTPFIEVQDLEFETSLTVYAGGHNYKTQNLLIA